VLQVIYRLEKATFALYVGQQLDVFLGGVQPGTPVTTESPVGGIAPAAAARPGPRGGPS
jgi:hypothetical protein